MSIKAIFPAGVDTLTVHGLHQWDYGRTLEISAPNLPLLVEVHFACTGQKNAVVRLASVTKGAALGLNDVATVIIPDICLEQTSPVEAWVYEVGATYGHTALTLILPVIARAKPTAATLPVAVGDKYTELIGHVNDILHQLEDGTIRVRNAAWSDQSVSSLHATKDSRQRVICDTYADGSADYVSKEGSLTLPAPGLYHVRVYYRDTHSLLAGFWVDFGVIYFDGTNGTEAVSGHASDLVRLYIHSDGTMIATGDSGAAGPSVYYYKLMWLETSATATSEEV